jgi:hypothetical protein
MHDLKLRVLAVTSVVGVVYVGTVLSIRWQQSHVDSAAADTCTNGDGIFVSDLGMADYMLEHLHVYIAMTLLVHLHTGIMIATCAVSAFKGADTFGLAQKIIVSILLGVLLNGCISIPPHSSPIQAEPSWLAFLIALFVPGANNIVAPRVMCAIFMHRHVCDHIIHVRPCTKLTLLVFQMVHISLYAWCTRQMPMPLVMLSMLLMPFVESVCGPRVCTSDIEHVCTPDESSSHFEVEICDMSEDDLSTDELEDLRPAHSSNAK